MTRTPDSRGPPSWSSGSGSSRRRSATCLCHSWSGSSTPTRDPSCPPMRRVRSPPSRAAQLFGQIPSNNFVYLVLERKTPLSEHDRQFYDRLTAGLRADGRHVYSVTDLWSQPATAAGAQSADGRAVTVMVRLAGMLGTSQARDSVNSVRTRDHHAVATGGSAGARHGSRRHDRRRIRCHRSADARNHRRHNCSHSAVTADGVSVADRRCHPTDVGRSRVGRGPRRSSRHWVCPTRLRCRCSRWHSWPR